MSRGKRVLNFAKDDVGTVDLLTKRCVLTMAEYGEDGYPLHVFREPIWEQQTQEPIRESAVDYQFFLAYCDLDPSERSMKRWIQYCSERGLLPPNRAAVNNKDSSRIRLYRWVERAAVYDIHQRQRKAAEWYKRDEARRDDQFQAGRKLVAYGKGVLEAVITADTEPDLGAALKSMNTGYLYQAEAVPQLQLSIDQMQNTLALLDPNKRAEVMRYLRAAKQGQPMSVTRMPELSDESDIIHSQNEDAIDAEVTLG